MLRGRLKTKRNSGRKELPLCWKSWISCHCTICRGVAEDQPTAKQWQSNIQPETWRKLTKGDGLEECSERKTEKSVFAWKITCALCCTLITLTKPAEKDWWQESTCTLLSGFSTGGCGPFRWSCEQSEAELVLTDRSWGKRQHTPPVRVIYHPVTAVGENNPFV